MKAFGGKIEIKSEENKGTDFIIQLKTKSKISRIEYHKFINKRINFESIKNPTEWSSSDKIDDQSPNSKLITFKRWKTPSFEIISERSIEEKKSE